MSQKDKTNKGLNILWRRKESVMKKNGYEIAVIGVVCQFPHVRDVDEYWNILVNGKERLRGLKTELPAGSVSIFRR